MKRLILLIVFSSCVAQAQQQAPCVKLSKVRVLEQDRVLHQNGEARIELTFQARGCFILFKGLRGGSYWPAVAIGEAQGLNVRTGAIGGAQFDQSTIYDPVMRGQEISVDLKVSSADGLQLGEHKLPGSLIYQVADKQGNVMDETLNFEVPIKVVQPRKVQRRFDERHPVWATLLIPVEIIAFIPLYILAGLMGWDGC